MVASNGEKTAINSGASSEGRERSDRTLFIKCSAAEEEGRTGRARDEVGEAEPLVIARNDAILWASLPSLPVFNTMCLG